jgi:hypothetical protein
MLTIANPDLASGVAAVRYEGLPPDLEPALVDLAADVSDATGRIVDLTATVTGDDDQPTVELACWVAGCATVRVEASGDDLATALARGRRKLRGQARSVLEEV